MNKISEFDAVILIIRGQKKKKQKKRVLCNLRYHPPGLQRRPVGLRQIIESSRGREGLGS